MDTAAKPARKKSRGLKIALVIVVVLFLLFVGAIALLPHFLPVDTIRGIAQSQAKQYGLAVDFKGLGISWNGSAIVNGISVSPLVEGAEGGEPLLYLDEVRTNVAISPLLSGKIVVNGVDVDGVKVKLRRDADGNLNLPDFSKLQAAAPAAGGSGGPTRMRLSAVAEAAPAMALPPIELHRLDVKNGLVSFEDEGAGLSLDVGLDFFHLEGATLNDPFVLGGRLLPYPGAPEKGEFPFTGRVAMIRDNALDLENGEASLLVEVNGFTLEELAAKLGLGDLVRAGRVDGRVQAGYAQQKALLSLSDMKMAGTTLGLGEGMVLNVPDTTATFGAEFDPGPGSVALRDMGLVNDIFSVKAQGLIEDVYGFAGGNPPTAAIDYSGSADFARASGYISGLGLDVGELPQLEGDANFSGRAVLSRRENPSDPLSPTFTLDFGDGRMGVREPGTGILANVDLSGVDLRAAASIGDGIAINAAVNLANVPLAAVVPQLTGEAINVRVNGGAAFELAGDAAAAEIRLKDTLAQIPATPWSQRMDIKNPEARLTYDLKADALAIQALSFTINDVIAGGIGAATVTGIQTGNPQGQADMELSALLEQVKAIFQPLVPEFAQELAGSVRAATRLRLADGAADAATRAEVDNAVVVLNLPKGLAKLEAPKTVVDLAAGARLDNPLAVSLQGLSVDNAGSVVQFAEKGGMSMSGRLGETVLRVAGSLNPDAMTATFTNLAVSVNGMALALGQGGQQTAGLNSGVMQAIVAGGENTLTVPVTGEGDFNLPSLQAGADQFVFYRLNNGQREDSDFGSLRAQLQADGYVGSHKPRIVNLRAATLSAKPIAAQARGQVDLTSGALAVAYAARLAPAGMTSLLGYLKLPPALLADAAVSGTLSFDGRQAVSKGMAQGQLRLASGEINPFEANHDLSAAFNPDDKSLVVAITQLEGNVKSGSGEAVATLKAQPSNLLLSRAGSKGLVDIRVNGAAAPTRMLFLGLTGFLPQLQEYSNLLYNSRAEGVYEGWLQVRDKDSSSIAVTLGGIWQGAALAINNVPYLAEAGKLSAALEGEFAYRDNRINVTRLFMQSDSAMMRADGAAQTSLVAGPDGHSIAGIGDVNVQFKFQMADLARASRVFPGVIAQDLGLTGRIDGDFQAGGDVQNIDVREANVKFEGFQARPGGLVVAIPSGNATFDGVFSLHLDRGASGGSGSPFDALRLFDLRNGQAALSGAQIQNKSVDTMTADFELANAVLNLRSAQVAIAGADGGGAAANGTVDFNSGQPAANLQVAVRNFPLSEVNEELKDFMQFESGVLNLPATQGQSAGVAFTGMSEDDILRTLRLENFTFATGAVTLNTGPVLNEQLNKARAIMKQETKGDAIVITLKSVSGSAQASGNGVITFPQSAPIEVVGDNTGDFRVSGTVSADHTMNLDFFVAGKLENLIGFNLPNLIPNLRSGTDEQRSRFMQRMNDNAAKGHYKVTVSGPLEQPNLDGIGALAGRFVTDIVAAAPAEILGGIVELGKDAPGALKDLGVGAAETLLNAPGNLKNAPENLINAPGKLGQGLGRMFGVGGGSGAAASGDGSGEGAGGAAQPEQEQNQQEQQEQRGLRGLERLFR